MSDQTHIDRLLNEAKRFADIYGLTTHEALVNHQTIALLAKADPRRLEVIAEALVQEAAGLDTPELGLTA